MKKYIIDTNALISFVTDRNPDQQIEIDRLFKDAAHLKILVLCPQNVLTEFVYVMDKVYQIPKSEINKMVRDFIDMPGIEVVHDINMKTLLAYWPKHFKDYGGAIVATLCKNVTLQRHLLNGPSLRPSFFDATDKQGDSCTESIVPIPALYPRRKSSRAEPPPRES